MCHNMYVITFESFFCNLAMECTNHSEYNSDLHSGMTRSEVTQKREHTRGIEEGGKDDGHWRTEGTDGTVVPMSFCRVIYCSDVSSCASLQLENRLHCAKFNKAIHTSTYLSLSLSLDSSNLSQPRVRSTANESNCSRVIIAQLRE